MFFNGFHVQPREITHPVPKVEIVENIACIGPRLTHALPREFDGCAYLFRVVPRGYGLQKAEKRLPAHACHFEGQTPPVYCCSGRFAGLNLCTCLVQDVVVPALMVCSKTFLFLTLTWVQQ